MQVKNTFINFNNPGASLPKALLRSATCPSFFPLSCSVADSASWEAATQVLCHAMAPKVCSSKEQMMLTPCDSPRSGSSTTLPDPTETLPEPEEQALTPCRSCEEYCSLDIEKEKIEEWTQVPSRKTKKMPKQREVQVVSPRDAASRPKPQRTANVAAAPAAPAVGGEDAAVNAAQESDAAHDAARPTLPLPAAASQRAPAAVVAAAPPSKASRPPRLHNTNLRREDARGGPANKPSVFSGTRGGQPAQGGATTPTNANAAAVAPSRGGRDRAAAAMCSEDQAGGGGASPSSATVVPATPSSSAPMMRDRDAPISQHHASPSGGKGKGKGKGLPHFDRLEVGIADDPQFRVVQRLIGPRGKHMQDIVDESKGAKVWIIGRGSRSWEDDIGPLMICVGAPSVAVFDVAISLATALLQRVKEDFARWESDPKNRSYWSRIHSASNTHS